LKNNNNLLVVLTTKKRSIVFLDLVLVGSIYIVYASIKTAGALLLALENPGESV